MSPAPVNPPIYLKPPSFIDEHNVNTVELEHYIAVAGNDVHHQARAPVIGDELKAKLACHIYNEFVDITQGTHLSLGAGPLKSKFWH